VKDTIKSFILESQRSKDSNLVGQLFKVLTTLLKYNKGEI